MLDERHIWDEILECGCDEAGRGCLAGDVYAAAVILPPGWGHPLLNDSKQLTERQREVLRPIIEQEALAWAVGTASVEEIDTLNILKASHLAMHRAIAQLRPQPGRLLIDGNRFTNYEGIPHVCIVKGDGKLRSIAAASVLAKTHRDEEMIRLSKRYPHYGWDKHKGYPTAEHKATIRKWGISPLHRKTFRY